MVVPPAVLRNYGDHPASIRLPVFAQLLSLDILDIMVVLQRARSWYLIDTRSPLTITGPEDLDFTEDDLRAVFTRSVIRSILEPAKKAAEEISNDLFVDWLIWLMGDVDELSRKLRESLVKDGFGALTLPIAAAVGGLIFGAKESRAVLPGTGGSVRINPVQLVDFFRSAATHQAQVHINDALAKLMDAIDQLESAWSSWGCEKIWRATRRAAKRVAA